MRNFKKFLALVLAMLMVVSAAATVSAFEDVAEDNQFAAAIADLSVLDIVNGYDETNFGPEDAVTRQQFALMMARAITGKTDDAEWAKGGLVAFDDVAEYQYAIATVVKAGIVDGFLDNTFRPEEGVTFIQALKMAVCALGYGEGLEWWQGYYNVALDLGLTDNLNQITDKDQALNRGEVAQLIYNMLYAVAADGNTLYDSIFAEPVEIPAEYTVLAIVATNKQYATENIKVAEGGYVGVQAVVNGVPSGEVYYLPIADFGFESDAEAEGYFLDAFAFANWNEGECDEIVPYGTKEVIYNTAITETAKAATNLGKLTIDGKNYYMVEEKTGTAIRNEVVVYNSSETAYVYTDKVLALDEDGKFYDENDTLVLSARFNSKGEIVAYYDYATKSYIDEEQATAKYGIPVVSDYNTHLGVMSQADLAGAYQLTVYDDDMDGVMDRAYYTPVYVAAHETNLNDSKLRYGPMASVKNTTFVDVDGNAVTLADAQVFKYTYNSQLNQVTVLNTYDVETGTLQRVNTASDNSSGKWIVKLTIDGEVYTMGNSAREANGLDGFTIYNKNASITEIANISGKTNAGGSFNSGYSALGYTYDNNFGPNTFKARDYVRFVAVDGVITVIESYDLEEAFDLVILDEVVDFDAEAIYMNLWFDGELVEDVAVTRIYDETTGKMVNVADLNYFKLSTLLNQVYSAKAGYAYRAVPTADGWQLSEAFKNVAADQAEIITDKCYVANDYKLAYLEAVAGQNTLVFDDGIGDTYNTNIKDVLRTDANTIFYFVKNNADVYRYVGQPQDGATIYNVDNGVEVYANKLGYATTDGNTNNIKGVADVVVVYYNNNTDIKGFGLTGIGEKIVYITEKTYAAGYAGKAGYLFDPYDNGTGADLGLSEEYWDGEFWFYNTNIGIDMHTGAAVNKIYAPYEMDIEQGHFYYLSDDNVVIGEVEAAKILTTNMNKADIVESRVTTIALDAGTITVDSYKFAGKATELKAANIKSDKTYLADTDLVVKYIDDNEDKIFVGIVCDAPAVEETGDTWTANTTVSATWNTDNKAELAADFDLAKLTGDIKIYVKQGDVQNPADNSYTNTVATVKVAKYDEATANYGTAAASTATATYANGVLTISKVNKPNTSFDLALDAGIYKVEVVFSDNGAGEATVVFEYILG